MWWIAILWYATGAALAVMTLREIDPVIRVKDLILVAVMAFMGPINVFYWLTYTELPFLDKPVFGRRK